MKEIKPHSQDLLKALIMAQLLSDKLLTESIKKEIKQLKKSGKWYYK